MKRRLQGLVLWLTMGLLLTACGASAARLNNEGNEDYEDGRYEEALEAYGKAQLENPDLAAPYYNAGNALLRQMKLSEAEAQMEQALRTAEEELLPQAHYNLGNDYYLGQNWPSAIEEYKETLRLSPDDMDAKHNLELALRQMQQQQQPPPPPQGGGGQQNNQDQQQNQQNEQEDQGQDEQDSEAPDGGQDEQEDQGQGQGQQEQPTGGGGGSGNLSPEEAKQILDALGQDTQTLQERLQQKRGGSADNRPEQDW